MGKKEIGIKKKKKKEKFITLNKRQKISLGATSIIAIAALVTGIYFFFEFEELEEFIFKCGLSGAPDSIDPLKNPGPRFENLIIIDQIAEGLFAYDQNKTNTPIVPNLALSGTWSPDYLNFTCTLRTDVTFHDGTQFNATAVKWNFDRIYKFIEIMPDSDTWAWYPAYLNSEGKPIINHTEIINNYTVRFVLNQPYVPIKDLLTLWSSYILSPTSTPDDDFIDIRTEKLVGTGPFIFDLCEVDLYGDGLKTDMHANPDYWGGTPSINKVSFLALYSDTERMERMLFGELSYAVGSRNDYRLEIYRNTTGITVVPKTKLNIFQLGMNNNKIDVTMRQAISYAFNYTRHIEDYWGGHAEKPRSPLSNRMRYSNWVDFDVPDYNITRARQLLLAANWTGTSGLTPNDNITTGNDWEMIANSPTPLGTYNFSTVWPWMEFIANQTIADLKQIGVKVNIINMEPVEFWDKLYAGKHEIFTTGWGVTRTDPVDVINPLYSSKVDGIGIGNHINFNDTEVQQWMEQALEEFNEAKREQLYFNIQQSLIEELNPVLWLAHPIDYDIWDSDVKGIPIDGAPLRLILKFCYLI
ncbi:MAG: ABC transporter substrate-binding protein [Candidatus Hermodarchaeota archaeon]